MRRSWDEVRTGAPRPVTGADDVTAGVIASAVVKCGHGVRRGARSFAGRRTRPDTRFDAVSRHSPRASPRASARGDARALSGGLRHSLDATHSDEWLQLAAMWTSDVSPGGVMEIVA